MGSAHPACCGSKPLATTTLLLLLLLESVAHRHVTQKNRELLNRVKKDQGEDVGKASVGPADMRAATATAYDTWAAQHLEDYKLRAAPRPSVPEVSELPQLTSGAGVHELQQGIQKWGPDLAMLCLAAL